MAKCVFELKDEEQTLKLGAELAVLLAPSAATSTRALCVFLEGDLGAGKTTMTRGFLNALGHIGAVRSPTYTLVEPYEFKAFTVFHFDLYRLLDPEELEYMGIRDYFSKKAVCLFEWPDKAGGHLPNPDVIVSFEYRKSSRNVMIKSDLLGEAALRALGLKFSYQD